MLYLVLHCICWLIAAILIKKQSCQRSGLHFQKSVQLVERYQKYMAAQCHRPIKCQIQWSCRHVNYGTKFMVFTMIYSKCTPSQNWCKWAYFWHVIGYGSFSHQMDCFIKCLKYLEPSTYCVILNTPPNGHKQTQTWLSNSCNLVGLWPKFYFDVAGHCIKKSLWKKKKLSVMITDRF